MYGICCAMVVVCSGGVCSSDSDSSVVAQELFFALFVFLFVFSALFCVLVLIFLVFRHVRFHFLIICSIRGCVWSCICHDGSVCLIMMIMRCLPTQEVTAGCSIFRYSSSRLMLVGLVIIFSGCASFLFVYQVCSIILPMRVCAKLSISRPLVFASCFVCSAYVSVGRIRAFRR